MQCGCSIPECHGHFSGPVAYNRAHPAMLHSTACTTSHVPAVHAAMLDVIGPIPEGEYLAITAAGSALGRMMLNVCKVGTAPVTATAAGAAVAPALNMGCQAHAVCLQVGLPGH